MKVSDTNACRFGLIRHAQTTWNLEKRIQGRKDSPLTAEGKRRAVNWGKQLKKIKWNRILSSDTGRALQTAVLINAALRVPLDVDARLQEQDWGFWTGKREPDIRRDDSRKLKELTNLGWDFRPPGGESRREVWKRSDAALRAAADAWPGTAFLIVTHEGIIKSLIYHLSGRRFLPSDPPLVRPGHLHQLIFTPGRKEMKIERINALKLSS